MSEPVDHTTEPRTDLIDEASRNWRERDWDEVDAMAAATSITRAHQIVLGRINDALGPLDLTFSRYEALALISFSREQALPLGKIGERLQVHPTSVTNTIDRLERDGLVERQPHPSDRRGTLAALTTDGRRRLARATSIMAKIRYGMGELDDVTCKQITEDLRPLRSSVADRFY